MKKFISIFLSVMMVLSFVPVSFAAESIKGDVDGDGKVTAADAELALNYALGKQDENFTAEMAARSKVIDGEKITVMDSEVILLASEGLIDINEPFKNKGPSGTEASGKCGENASYKLSADGVLTISGTGEIKANAFLGNTDIVEVEIEEGIEFIEKNAFRYCPNMEFVSLPESLNAISEGAFSSCFSLYKVVIPKHVRDIERKAFIGCRKLSRVIFSASGPEEENKKGLGKLSFAGTSIMTLDFTGLALRMGEGAFAYCDALRTVNFGHINIKAISANAFLKDSYIEMVVIPESVERIDAGAFSGCESLTDLYCLSKTCTVTTDENIETVPDLTVIHAVNDAAIKKYAEAKGKFAELEDTTGKCGENINYSYHNGTLTLTTTEESAEWKDVNNFSPFRGDKDIIYIDIDKKIKNLPIGAFSGCTNLRSITLPEGLEKIELEAFAGCWSLAYVSFPASLKSLGLRAFADCHSLGNIKFTDSSNLTEYDNGVFFCTAYYEDVDFIHNAPLYLDCILLRAPRGDISEFKVKDGTKFIDVESFGGGDSLKSVILPDGLLGINTGAFSGCNGIKELTVPASVKIIRESVFSDNLGKLTVKSTDCKFVDNIFGYEPKAVICGYKNSTAQTYAEEYGLTFEEYTHDHVMGPWEYNGYNTHKSKCTVEGCTYYTCEPCTYGEWETVTEAGAKEPGLEKRVCTKCGHEEKRKTPPTENKLGEDICYILENGVLDIYGTGSTYPWAHNKRSPFYENKDVKVINIHDGVTEITPETFKGCENTEKINLPAGLEVIGVSAFENCKKIKSLYIPSSVKNIGNTAFAGCPELMNIKFEDSYTLEEFGRGVFRDSAFVNQPANGRTELYLGCILFNTYDNNATSYTVKQGTKFIEENALSGRTHVKEVKLPDSLLSINWEAFNGCNEIENLVIPASVKYIDAQVFSPKIKKITFMNPGTRFSMSNIFEMVGGSLIETVIFGYEGSTAEACANRWGVKFEALPIEGHIHAMGEWVHTADGKHERKCIVKGCEYKETGECVLGDWEVIQEPTCVKAGSKVRRCPLCGYYEQEEIPATGNHNFGEWKVVKAATCSEKGKEERVCSVCGTKETREIPLGAHVNGSPVRENEIPPTYINEGSYEEVVYCSVCKKEVSRVKHSIPKLVPVNEPIRNEESGAVLKYADGTVAKDVKLNVAAENKTESVKTVMKEKSKFAAKVFDINLSDAKGKVQPDGYVLVGVPLPVGFSNKNTFVYHVNGDKLEKMNSFMKYGLIWFETNHFSSYALVDESQKLVFGDIDGGGITAADARAVLRLSVGLGSELSEVQKAAADVDGDMDITASDARLILRKSVNLEEIPRNK